MPRSRIACFVVALALAGHARAASCPTGGVVTIAGDNRSADAAVDLVVFGHRVASAGGCDPSGTGLVTAYATTVTCSGAGTSRCGRITGLAPGVWVHRVAAQVDDPMSALQIQAQEGMVVAGPGASNVVEWTVYGRTYVVTNATRADFRAQLDAARTYTAGSTPRPALVRFSHTAFPGATDPKTIALQTSPTCALDTCVDGREAAYCLDGSHVVVDALDDEGRPGGVVLTPGTCNNSLLRIYGSANVWRGLVFQGTTDPMPAVATDTLTIAGLDSGGNRLERCTVIGPTRGDALSVEGDATQPGAGPAPENAVVASEIRGAEDKGIKVDFGGVARVERSCIHDNANGGIQATLGGTVTAVENVIQHNVGGAAENGLFAGVPNPQDSQFPNVLTTLGNVVRFNGARGVSVVNNATATLGDDVVTDNYRAGLRVETLLAGVTPSVSVRGGVFACNYAAGLCLNGMGRVCRMNGECSSQVCSGASGAATGVGVALDQPCVGCGPPDVDLGLGGANAGRNAFTLNANPNAAAPGGINVSSAMATATDVPAAGNQWEHCDVPELDPVNPNKCNVGQVATYDVRLAPGATALDLGTPTGPRHGPNPVVTAISPPRPRMGELVRVYGGAFDAIDGMACYPPASLPGDPCDAGNADTVAKNAANVSQGNHVTVTLDGTDYAADVHQVTPTMLVFAMPVDCWAPATLTVARGNDVAAPVGFCDPSGCAGRPIGAICDDDDACTLGETCRSDGTCGGAAPRDCRGQCLTGACDPVLGCAARPVSAPCEDGDACTLGDHCSGTSDSCVSGAPVSCAGQCLTGGCDPATGCRVRGVTAACDDGNPCTAGDHCSGSGDACVGSVTDCDDHLDCTADGCDAVAGCTHFAQPDGASCPRGDACHGAGICAGGVCMPGPAVSCDDGQACTDDVCAAASGICEHVARVAFDGVTCHVAQLRTLVGGIAEAPPSRLRSFGTRLDCVDRRLALAARAADGSRKRRKQARRAARCLARFAGRVKLTDALAPAERRALGDEAARLRTALDDYFGR